MTVAFDKRHDPGTEVQYSEAFKAAAEEYEVVMNEWFRQFPSGVQEVSVVGLRYV